MCKPGDRVVSVSFLDTSESVIFDGNLATWHDDNFYNIEIDTARVVKFPIRRIKRITEGYGYQTELERKEERE